MRAGTWVCVAPVAASALRAWIPAVLDSPQQVAQHPLRREAWQVLPLPILRKAMSSSQAASREARTRSCSRPVALVAVRSRWCPVEAKSRSRGRSTRVVGAGQELMRVRCTQQVVEAALVATSCCKECRWRSPASCLRMAAVAAQETREFRRMTVRRGPTLSNPGPMRTTVGPERAATVVVAEAASVAAHPTMGFRALTARVAPVVEVGVLG